MKAAILSSYGRLAQEWLARHREELKPLLLALAVSIFCGGLYLSVHARPDIFHQLSFGPLLVIFFITLPAGMAISAADFQLLAKLSGVQVNFWRAIEIVIFTRAANMLPIPGSFAVRMAALKACGVGLRRSGELMFLFTMIWGGVGFCFSAAWLLPQAPLAYGVAFALAGASLLFVCAMWCLRNRINFATIGGVFLLRSALIVLEAFVLLMAVRSVGVDVQYSQTAILVVASFLSSTIPAGIGVREAILAALAPLAGIDPATGFLAGAAARFTSMAFLAVCSLGALAVQQACK